MPVTSTQVLSEGHTNRLIVLLTISLDIGSKGTGLELIADSESGLDDQHNLGSILMKELRLKIGERVSVIVTVADLIVSMDF